MEMPIGFDQVKELVDTLIDWLKDFFQALEDMFGGIKYEFAGYKTEENNKPV